MLMLALTELHLFREHRQRQHMLHRADCAEQRCLMGLAGKKLSKFVLSGVVEISGVLENIGRLKAHAELVEASSDSLQRSVYCSNDWVRHIYHKCLWSSKPRLGAKFDYVDLRYP